MNLFLMNNHTLGWSNSGKFKTLSNVLQSSNKFPVKKMYVFGVIILTQISF